MTCELHELVHDESEQYGLARRPEEGEELSRHDLDMGAVAPIQGGQI